MTTADVAREAGVSRATVSYVLNETPHQRISETTRRKVLDVAARLGYEPSAAARVLRRGRSDLVVAVLPDYSIGPTFTEFLRELATALHRYRLTLMVHPKPKGVGDIRHLWQAVSPGAAIRLDSVHDDAEAYEHLQIPTAQVVYARQEGDGLLMVVPNEEFGQAQVGALAERGYRRLAYAYPANPVLVVCAEPRLAGVRTACEQLGLEPPVVSTVSIDLGSAKEAIAAWLDHGVTAVCAYNDEVALVLLQAARQMGVDVPGELAVIGVDDLPGAAMATPSLATVTLDVAPLADEVARRLAAVMDHAEPCPPVAEGIFEVVVRASI